MSGLKGRNPIPVTALTLVFVKSQILLKTHPKILYFTFLKTRLKVLRYRTNHQSKRRFYHQDTATTKNKNESDNKLLSSKLIL